MADYNSTYTGVQIDANLALAATAVQDADLATVATTGAYTDLTGKPTLGTAAAAATGDFATAAQGALAASAVQPADDAADLGSGAATDGYVLTADGAGGAAWEAAAGGGGSSVTDYLRTRLGTVQDVFNMADTWNASGTTFTGIKLNVTDTASAAGSLLMDLQVGGVSRFSVDKAGAITVPSTSGYGNSGIRFSGISPRIYANSNILSLNNGSYGAIGADFGASQARINGAVAFGFSNGDVTNALDVILARDAANTLAQRNGTAAQTKRLYGTFTDTSNYRRLAQTMSTAGVAEIKPEGAGTGASGNVLHISGLPTSNPGPGILWNNAGTPAIGT